MLSVKKVLLSLITILILLISQLTFIELARASADTTAPIFDTFTLVTNGNPGYAKLGDKVTITLNIAPADTWKSGNNAIFSIGNTVGLATGNFTTAVSERTFRNKTYTILTNQNGAFSFTDLIFSDVADNAITGFSSFTPTPNIIVDTIAPIITSSSIATIISENSEAGQVIYTVVATDINTVVYSLSGTDASLFSISGASVILTSSPNFETKPSYSFNVVATDAAGNITEKPITLTITDINEAPIITNTDGSDGSSKINLDENTSPALQITVSDEDVNDTITYSIVTGTDAVDGAFFNITNSGVLHLNNTLDFETPRPAGATDQEYWVRVKATDTDGLSDIYFLKYEIKDINEAPVITGEATATFSVVENQTVVTNITSTDVDAGQAGTLLTTLTGADAGKFNISSAGVVTFKVSPDFERPASAANSNVYTVVVTVTDGALVDTQTIIITVTNISENRSSGRISNLSKVCKDKKASNYNRKGKHLKSVCKYDLIVMETVETASFEREKCSLPEILSQNLKLGDRDGKYSKWQKEKITEIKVLQKHLNRLGFTLLLVDGILGPASDVAIKKLQKFLGTKQDGLVGLETRRLINNSCKKGMVKVLENDTEDSAEENKKLINSLKKTLKSLSEELVEKLKEQGN